MSLTLSPPYIVGAQILCQLTKHFPPEASSSRVQRKFCRSLLKILIIHFSAGKIVRKYVAMEVITLFMSVSLPSPTL
jgi:hypothetical protein